MGHKKANGPESFSELARSLQKAAPYINIIYVLFSAIILFGIIGWWLDSKFSIKPLFFILGLFAGLAIGFYNFFKVVKNLENKEK